MHWVELPLILQSILHGTTSGAAQRAEEGDPAMVEGDQGKEKVVQVTAGWFLVEIHVTNWARDKREDP